MFDRLLIPLDGSTLAERALEPGFTIAGAGTGQVILLRVPVYKQAMSPSAASYGWIIADQEQGRGLNEAAEYLNAKVFDYSQPGLEIRPLVKGGDVASTIVDTALDNQVDLIVLTTHGYSGITRWMLGSVTERVLRSAPCPVLVIRHDRPIKQFLICLDGSRLAEQVLKPGLEIARRLAEKITLLRIDHQEKLSSFELGLLEMADSELCKELERHPEKRLHYYLDCLREKFDDYGLPIDTAVVKGEPAQAILEYAESHSVDLIAMATHGYSGLRRWVYGSVTEKVLRKAYSAMLVVRPPAELLK